MRPSLPIWLWAIVPVVLVVGLLMAWGQHRWSKARELVQAWAKRHDYHLLDVQQVSPLTSPFALTTSQHQFVHRVTIRDQAGSVRRGWTQCGGYVLGLMEERVVVRWADEVFPSRVEHGEPPKQGDKDLMQEYE